MSERRPRRLVVVVGSIVLALVAMLAAVGIERLRTGGAGPGHGAFGAPSVPVPDPGGVAGYLFQDRDGDHQHGKNEPVLTDWTVRLYSVGGFLPLLQTRTDSRGIFAFPDIANLPSGATAVQLRVTPVFEGPAATTIPSDTGVTQTYAAPLGGRTTIPVASYRTCLSLDACPGVELPDLQALLTTSNPENPPPTATLIDTTTEPGHVLLRFASSTLNGGGLLHLVAAPMSETASGDACQTVYQLVYGIGVVYAHQGGCFEYHPEHHHFHFDDFERFDLLSADQSQVVATSGKVSFCLTDSESVSAPPRSDGAVFLDLPPYNCGEEEQGINTGYADYYGRGLPDQWIDVTGVPSGSYWIRITSNPHGLLLESDMTNNAAAFQIDYQAPG